MEWDAFPCISPDCEAEAEHSLLDTFRIAVNHNMPMAVSYLQYYTERVLMIYSKNYRILKLDGSIIGCRATKKEAIALALRQSDRLSESIEIKKRNAQGIYMHFTISLNPEKFVEY